MGVVFSLSTECGRCQEVNINVQLMSKLFKRQQFFSIVDSIKNVIIMRVQGN